MIEELESIRRSIDLIDDEILDKLISRLELAAQVGKLKNQTQGNAYRPEREHSILERLTTRKTGLLTQQAIRNIFLEIFAVSRNIEATDKIGYLGPEGSFTHQAAKERLGRSGFLMPLKTIAAVFEAVDSEQLKFGVIPIENNQEGTVNETVRNLHLLDVKIIAEVIIPIRMVLASHQEDITQIERIYSKDIAFRQCRNFLKNHFIDHIGKRAVSSTSSAAQKAVQDSGAAAICSKISAERFDLPILFDNIQDSNHNYTRFIIISKTNDQNQSSKQSKTTILVNLANSQKAGTLATFLDSFKVNSINMNKLESYPERGSRHFSYWFLIDFEGHFYDANFQKIYSEYRESIKWLGSYIKDEYYLTD